MRILINIIAFITFVAQFISFVLNALTLRTPECVIDSLYIYFFILAYICSLITINVFVVLYNINFILHKKSIRNILISIVILGVYIHIWQLMNLKDFMLISCILLFFDFYIIRNLITR